GAAGMGVSTAVECEAMETSYRELLKTAVAFTLPPANPVSVAASSRSIQGRPGTDPDRAPNTSSVFGGNSLSISSTTGRTSRRAGADLRLLRRWKWLSQDMGPLRGVRLAAEEKGAAAR